MKTYKSIAYAYPSSPAAEHLGFPDTGCLHIQQRHDNIEDSGQSSGDFMVHNAEGYQSVCDDLINQYLETDGEPCPMFLQYGLPDVLGAIENARIANLNEENQPL